MGTEIPKWCRYCFGVLAGAAGLVTGFTGLGAVVPAAGAGTPDCTLKASMTGCVISTAGPYQITGPRGHCCDVSRIMPYPLSPANFTMSGAILVRILLPI